jgi:hypothetical protein
MKEINVPFSLYDFFAILLPGGVGVFGLYLFFNPTLSAEGHQAAAAGVQLSDLNEILLATGVIVLSYLLGHLLNAFSELLIDRPANATLGWSGSIFLRNLGLLVDNGLKWFEFRGGRFSLVRRDYNWVEAQKVKPVGQALKKCVEDKFGSIFENKGYTFTYVRAFVGQNAPEMAAEARIFIATATMFQSLMLAVVLIAAALFKGISAGQIGPWAFWPSVITTITLMCMFFISYRRYKRMWVETIFAGFIVAVKSEKKGKKE